MGYVYQLPFGSGRKYGGGRARWLDLAAGQWQVNGITTFQTGTPISISASNSIGLFNLTSRANNNSRSAKLTGPVHERRNRYYDINVLCQHAHHRHRACGASPSCVRIRLPYSLRRKRTCFAGSQLSHSPPWP